MMKISSNDGQEFEIDDAIIQQSTLFASLLEEGNVDEVIPLSKVKGSILKSVIDYCAHHKNDRLSESIDDDDEDDPDRDIYEPRRSDDISEWDQSFIQQFTVQDGTLFDIIMAANYLGVKTLLAVGCKTVANSVRGKSTSGVREMFNITKADPSTGLTVNENVIESTETSVGNDQSTTSHEPNPMNE